MKTLLVPALLFSGALLVSADVVTITLPPETAVFKPGAGIETAQANCLICHSADYLRMQPPMPRKFWEAEVKKMQGKYGAPIADDKITALVDYLTTAYGVGEAAKK